MGLIKTISDYRRYWKTGRILHVYIDRRTHQLCKVKQSFKEWKIREEQEARFFKIEKKIEMGLLEPEPKPYTGLLGEGRKVGEYPIVIYDLRVSEGIPHTLIQLAESYSPEGESNPGIKIELIHKKQEDEYNSKSWLKYPMGLLGGLMVGYMLKKGHKNNKSLLKYSFGILGGLTLSYMFKKTKVPSPRPVTDSEQIRESIEYIIEKNRLVVGKQKPVYVEPQPMPTQPM